MTSLSLESLSVQQRIWPQSGKVVLAQFDESNVVVYQAFNHVTADYAVEHQQLGGPRYKLTRMSWVKPNFFWMMYRCDWLQADFDQSRVLAITIRRTFFDELLRSAVASSLGASHLDDQDAWKSAIQSSSVRLQWDPDHDPHGEKLDRRAIQLGLRGEMLRRFVEEETIRIEDISEHVIAQRAHRSSPEKLMAPRERPYPVVDPLARERLGM